MGSNNVVKMTDNAHKELANIAEWMRVNKLSPNPQKAEFMITGYPLSTRKPALPETLELKVGHLSKI